MVVINIRDSRSTVDLIVDACVLAPSRCYIIRRKWRQFIAFLIDLDNLITVHVNLIPLFLPIAMYIKSLTSGRVLFRSIDAKIRQAQRKSFAYR